MAARLWTGPVAALILGLLMAFVPVSHGRTAGLAAEIAPYDAPSPLLIGKRGKLRWFVARGPGNCRLIVAETRELFLYPFGGIGFDWTGDCGPDGLATGRVSLHVDFIAIAPNGKETYYRAYGSATATQGVLDGPGQVSLSWGDGKKFNQSSYVNRRPFHYATGCVYTMTPDGTPNPVSRDADCVEADAVALRHYVLAALAGKGATEPPHPPGLAIPTGPKRSFKTICKCAEDDEGWEFDIKALSADAAKSETERQCNAFCSGPSF